ncbi:mechanosensitive ion channel domain-containing protein [uncultured Aquitalea sp.]|uniref:mechanosensitive ion channel family protein n=1 Tax=uncultured Aquitalea sp. TaxID=540272 RepID=UPI0025E35344|nr:mechanosensitive ion channel domain-containing protein [uncultured Aquitalea sp.]
MPSARLLRACLSLLCLFFVLCAPARAAEPRLAPDAWEQERTLTLGNTPVYLFLAREGELTPQQRVERVRARLAVLDESDAAKPVTATPFGGGASAGYRLAVNGKPLFNILAGDLDPADGLSLQQSAANVQKRLDDLRLAYLEQHSASSLSLGAGLGLLGTLVFAAILWLVLKARGLSLQKLTQRTALGPAWLRRRPELQQLLSMLERGVINITALLVGLFATYIWLTWLLARFPYTLPFSRRLGRFLFGLFGDLGASALGAVPGLLTVAIIFLLTRLLGRCVQLLFDMVERGQLSLPGMHAETIGATRRLVSTVLWLFALTVAYPYLPGANTDAFKGMSVFFGLLVTLGSAGIMNHAMSGLVLVYSRAMRPGDFVRVGDVEGVVTELSALSTKIKTRNDHEITVPNAVVVGGKVENFSRTQDGVGMMITTTVTIGYDTPWRQVKAMLELAARRTRLIDQRLPMRVRMLALQDFYVEYELQARGLPGQLSHDVRSELHGHIQDIFNEFGVQIMSPHFIAQPENNVLVPREHWYDAPAQADQDPPPPAKD